MKKAFQNFRLKLKNSSKWVNQFIYNKYFSSSALKLADIDKILNEARKQNERLTEWRKILDDAKEKEKEEEEKQKKEEEKKEKQIEKLHQEDKLEEPAKENKESTNTSTFFTEAKGNLDKLINKQEKVEDKLIDRVEKGYEKLDEGVADEILDKFEDRREKIKEKIHEKAAKLEEEFKGEIKSVEYFQKKVDIEAAGFKKLTQALEKEEEEIDKQIKNDQDYKNYKDKYEKERSEWKEEHQENVRNCRQDKQDIKKHLESNLEKPGEMAESLVNETGPDYTGCDD
jgi:hypothetical protein